jgi:uncharacterized protein YyaL (SSP411 family)
MIEDFWDGEQGGFYSTPRGNDDLPVRPKELVDGALPSINSVSLYNLLMLSRLTGDSLWEKKAHELARAFAGSVRLQPSAFTFFLSGLDFALRPGQEIVVAGSPDGADAKALLSALNLDFSPNRVTIFKSDQNAGRLARFAGYTDGLQVKAGQAVAHICRNGACLDSAADLQTLLGMIQSGKRS